jgi:phytoene synthase
MPVSFNADAGIAREDLAACRALLRDGSRTFFAASLLLPASIRASATALYAFCRLADDAIDLDRTSPAAAIERLRERLAAIYAGAPLPFPADRAFAATVARFDIPRAMPEALIEGFAWDVAGRNYETLSDLNAYGARVAGSVGAMMTLVMGRRASETVSRACELGMAMQLSNIARDVGEDARAGRLYLPRQWMREAGLDPEAWLAQPVFNPALGGVLRRLLEAADHLYTRSAAGIDDLPALCRPAIRAARFLYAEIGDMVAANGFDSVSQRAVVGSSRKVQVLARSLVIREQSNGAIASSVDDAARFLIESVPDAPAPQKSRDSIAWLVDLFERLEKKDQIRRGRTWESGYRSRPKRDRFRGPRQPSQLQKVEC